MQILTCPSADCFPTLYVCNLEMVLVCLEFDLMIYCLYLAILLLVISLCCLNHWILLSLCCLALLMAISLVLTALWRMILAYLRSDALCLTSRTLWALSLL